MSSDSVPDVCPWDDTETPSGWSTATRAQTFFVPLHYESNYRYPLIVWLHSDGFNENQVCHVMPHVSTRNYLATGIRAPKSSDASGHRFEWGGGVTALESAERTVLQAINRAADQYSVHAERIVLAGYQRGGEMALRIAMQNPELFAAAISLGGEFGLPNENLIDRERLRQRRLPMLWQRSIENQDFSSERFLGEIQAAISIKAQLEIRQYRNSDEMNSVVLADLDRWVMDHVVNGAPVVKMNPWDTSPTSFSDN
ncbi:dienelactone hydrolase family protein [Stieleria sp. TO1_6]|uniref:alpha/beta hydrolase n=1 Tax=Stieleria tagensis TaxID=2956795 RepID=UPI00209AFFA5|nr:dienelactone hydrolase family protein [Stieleria tagensis]MCO8124427.1 dienelactone hydrolase family protein [Stieleria tagensis]